MSDQAMNALIAVALGTAVAVLLLVPTAAVQYRLDGRLGPRDLAVLVSAAIYGLALWTYTLLPFPPAGDYTCKGRQLHLLGFAEAIRAQAQHVDGPAGLLRDPVFLQVALNVLLFVPFGYFVRVVLRRGVVVATVLGFGVSLLIETTQLTGVWGLYGCAYRLFDVDDLLVNTLGALAGSLLSTLVVRRHRDARPLPTSITFGRRLVGMVSDVLFLALLGAGLALAWRGLQLYGLERPVSRLDLDTQLVLQWGVPFAVEALCVLGLGRTVGELVVSVRTVLRRPRLVLASRLVKLASGITPLVVIPLASPPYAVVLLAAYVLLTLVVAWRSRQHRGLSHVLAALDLEVGR